MKRLIATLMLAGCGGMNLISPTDPTCPGASMRAEQSNGTITCAWACAAYSSPAGAPNTDGGAVALQWAPLSDGGWELISESVAPGCH